MISNEFIYGQDKKYSEIFNVSAMMMGPASYEVLFDVAGTNEWTTYYSQIEGGKGTKYVAEGENYDEVKVNEGYESVLTTKKFANEIRITDTTREKAKDNTVLFNEEVTFLIVNALNSARDFVEEETVQMLTDYSDFLAPDAVAVFGAHNWKNGDASTAWTNLQTGAAFSSTQLDAVEAYAGDLVDSTGRPIKDIDFDTIITGKGTASSTLVKKTLQSINNGQFETSTVGNVIITNYGSYKHIELRRLNRNAAGTSLTNGYWFKSSRPYNGKASLIVEFVKMPTMGEGIPQTNGDIVYGVTGFFKFGCVRMPIDWIYNPGA